MLVVAISRIITERVHATLQDPFHRLTTREQALLCPLDIPDHSENVRIHSLLSM
jgi:hypothetical protein